MKREGAEKRLLEVLLEEELGGARRRGASAHERPDPRPLRGRWLAAAVVLLGVGTVVAAFALQGRGGAWPGAAERRPAGQPQDPQPQDPQPGEPQPLELVGVVPHSREEFVDLLAGVRSIRVHSLRPQGRGTQDTLVTLATDGTTRFWTLESPATGQRHTAYGQADPWKARNVAPDPLAVLEIRDSGELADWVRDLRSSPAAASSDPDDPVVVRADRWAVWTRAGEGFDYGTGDRAAVPCTELAFELADGRLLGAVFDPATRVLRCSDALGLRVGEELLQRIGTAAQASERNGRLARGIVLDLDDLRLLPAATRSVQCPWPTAEQVRTGLARLPALERLSIGPHAKAAPPGREVLAALAGLPALRSLELCADPALPALDALAGLVQLEELRLAAAEPQRAGGGAAAAQSALADLLPRLPRLRALALGGAAFGDADLEVLPRTKVERLQLVGTRASAAGLRHLAALPSLRELDLDGWQALDEVGCEAFGTLGGLRRLRIRLARGQPDGDAVARLRRRLPDCEIAVEQGPGWRAAAVWTAPPPVSAPLPVYLPPPGHGR